MKQRYICSKVDCVSEYIATIIIFLLLSGCSAGKHYNYSTNKATPSFLTERLGDSKKETLAKPVPTHKIKISEKKEHTLFAHPGLIFGIDWGGSRAYGAGARLLKDGYYSDILEIRSRKYLPMYKQMVKENVSSYLGVHFSLGGTPAVLAEAIKASKKASLELDKPIVYNAIMVDPYSFTDFTDYVNPDSPYLGTVFVILSSNYSFLRPGVKGVPDKISNHPKIHFIYPDEFGIRWDHFGFLSAIMDDTKEDLNSLKVRAIFYFLVNAIYQKAESNIIKAGLRQLK